MDAPTKLKHYEILSRIGEGGMGVVYRARDTRLGRTVALKMLHGDLAHDEERSRRFEREARIVSSLSHPGIATLYEFDREGETTFLTMELVQGPTLRELLRRGSLSVDQVLDCALQVAEAVAAAHREGVIHRDLKPENIMVASSGYYKVLDFGVARIHDLTEGRAEGSTQLETRSWATSAGDLVGTVAYMSPEQAMAEPLDARSDIFSFGSLLYELCTGRPAFQGRNAMATAEAIAHRHPPSVRSIRPEIPHGLELVIDKCLAKRPAERYDSAEDLVRDLRELQRRTLSGSGGRPRLVAGRRAPWPRWSRWLAGSALAAAALAALVLLLARPAEIPAPRPGVTGGPAGPGSVLPAAHEGTARVVVGFFENLTGDAGADWLSRGLPEMLTTDLSRSGRLEVISSQRLHDLAETAGGGAAAELDRASETELARWVGADVVVSGSVFKLGGTYRIDAQAYETTGGTVLVARKVEGTDLFAMVNRLTAALLQGLSVATAPEGSLERVTTSSEEAFRLYTVAKDAYDNLRFDEAAEQLRRALALDPDFALARLRLAITLVVAGDETQASALSDELVQQVQRLPESDRLLALGLHALVVERDLEAARTYLRQLEREYPGSRVGPVLLARALSELGGDHVDATRILRSTVEADPNDLPALAALAEELTHFGQGAAAAGILREAARRNPEAAGPLEHLLETIRHEAPGSGSGGTVEGGGK